MDAIVEAVAELERPADTPARLVERIAADAADAVAIERRSIEPRPQHPHAIARQADAVDVDVLVDKVEPPAGDQR